MCLGSLLQPLLGLSRTVISPVSDTTSVLGVTGFMDVSACILCVPMDEEYKAQLLQAHHHLSNSHPWSVEAERLFLHLKQTQIPVRSTTKVSEVWEKQTKPA